MKWIILVPTILMLSACSCCSRGYSAGVVTPAVVVRPAALVPVSYVNHYDPVTVIEDEPIEVTATRVDYY
ncbi:MAG: hypothetical protein H0U73_02540 [Tatlockia sp.]|nr:hypothetical protein [Tatlockia sp.]